MTAARLCMLDAYIRSKQGHSVVSSNQLVKARVPCAHSLVPDLLPGVCTVPNVFIYPALSRDKAALLHMSLPLRIRFVSSVSLPLSLTFVHFPLRLQISFLVRFSDVRTLRLFNRRLAVSDIFRFNNEDNIVRRSLIYRFQAVFSPFRTLFH